MTSALQSKHDKRIILDQGKRIIALTELLGYYKEITETVREPFIILNNGLVVVTANQAFYRKFKVLKKDTEGKRIYNLGDNQWDVPELRELLENILPTHQVFNNYEITHNFPKVGVKTMLLNARQIDAKQLILLAFEDVTESKQIRLNSKELASKLTKKRDELQRLNDSKDEFISLASHQLRTPATAVKQYISMLCEGYAGKVTEEQANMLTIAYQNNERQLEIINDLLRVARIDAGKISINKSLSNMVHQIDTVVEQQTEMFKKRGQQIVFNRPIKPIHAFIDPKLMLMVLENLLDNAGKYSSKGQKITVDVSQNSKFTTVSIKDAGVGIDKKDQQKLFKKFSRIDNSLSASTNGSGLGLYWAKKILDLHDGSIEVFSTPNKGSTFTVKTPV